MDHPAENLSERAEQKLIFRMDNYHSTLQKSLHKQWVDGQNCDLVISTQSCEIAVHSCVIVSFSSKISDHLLQASVTRALASITGTQSYNSDDGDVKVSVLKSGEKRVQMNADAEILQGLLKFMYTGSLHIPACKATELLELAKQLEIPVVVNVVQVYVERNLSSTPNSNPVITLSDLFSGKNFNSSDITENNSAGGEKSPVLCLDSVELNATSEPLDTDLAAYINSPACFPGKQKPISRKPVSKRSAAASKKQSCTSATKRKRNNSSAKSSESLVISNSDESGDDVSVHFEKKASSKSTGKSSAKNIKASTKKRLLVKLVNKTSTASKKKKTRRQSDYETDSATDVEEEDWQDDENSLDAEGLSKSSCSDENDILETSGDADFLPYVCEFCKEGFKKKQPLDRHIAMNHKHDVFSATTCPHSQCDKRFEVLEEYRTHCKEVHGEIACEKGACTFTADNQKKMNWHYSSAHRCKIKCEFCRHTSFTKNSLRRHHEKAHAKVSCPYCNKTFVGRLKLVKHKQSVHTHKCEKCERWFTRKSHLARHMANKNGCRKRKRSSKKNSDLASNSPNPNNQTKSEEQVSEKAESVAVKTELLDLSDLAQHFPSHGISGDNDCHDADQSLETKPDVKTRGKKRRPYKGIGRSMKTWCRLCNKQLDSEEAYFEHLRQKHENQTFPCTQCGRVFLRKESLTNHVTLSHDKRNWVCPYCSQEFSKGKGYAEHCLAEHADPKPFRCRFCDYRTSLVKLMNSHERKQHIEGRKTEVCDKCGGSFLFLRIHQKSCLKLEQHLCSTCGEVFPLRSTLKSHISVVHGGERAYPCNICHRRFSCHANRNRHMRIHNNNFPYTCEYCGQMFRHSNTLKDHANRIHHKNT